ncbi:MAG: lysophospholipase [Pseudomonadota bacterium]
MSSPSPHTHQIHAADGTLLHVCDYLLPMAACHGSVVIMHGLGEHGGRYRHVAAFFNACGLSVRCYDHRGHGRSGGQRGDVIHGDPMLQDGEIVIDDFAARFPDPPFLFGHSMGGLFATRFALAKPSPLRGLILSSPALALRLSSVQATALKILRAIAPSIGVPNGLSPQFLSHDAAVVDAYKNDPLVHGKISARLLTSMLTSIDYCHEHAAALSVPTLMVVAGDDRLVDPQGSRDFFAKLPPGLATMHVHENLFHEVFNEIDARRAFDDVRRYLVAQGVASAEGAALSLHM